MRYVDAITSTCTDLDGDTSGEVVRAGLRLARSAWCELGGTDPGWDRFGLHVLAAEELLRHLPDATVKCEPPSRTDPDVRDAVTRLLTAVANRLDRASGDETRSLADRLACDAAAGLVRHALAVLP